VAPRFDLVLSGGAVFDPVASRFQSADVAFAGGRVAALAPAIDPTDAVRSVNVSGAMVTPGLVDIHAHVFDGIGEGLDADAYCLARGTTTVADAGTAGANMIGAFIRQMAGYRTDVLVWLNLSTIGQTDHRYGELIALIHADVSSAVRAVERFRDRIVGLKARLSTYVTGGTCLPVMRLLIDCAERTGLPVMVHVGDTGEPLPEILALLRPGDIVTHFLTGRRHGILQPDGALYPEVHAARARGVLFDTGHGRGNFSFAVAQAAIAEGFLPDTVSTDLTHTTALDPAFGMPLMATELLALGMTIEGILERMTTRAAAAVNRPEFGRLAPGSLGDATILVFGPAALLTDSTGHSMEVPRSVIATGVVKAGAHMPISVFS
jgi:dihydroorotase